MQEVRGKKKEKRELRAESFLSMMPTFKLFLSFTGSWCSSHPLFPCLQSGGYNFFLGSDTWVNWIILSTSLYIFFGVDTCTLYIVYWILLSLHYIRPVQPTMHAIFVFPLCTFILLRIFLQWTKLGSRKYMAGYAINLCVLMTWNDECKWYFQIHL